MRSNRGAVAAFGTSLRMLFIALICLSSVACKNVLEGRLSDVGYLKSSQSDDQLREEAQLPQDSQGVAADSNSAGQTGAMGKSVPLGQSQSGAVAVSFDAQGEVYTPVVSPILKDGRHIPYLVYYSRGQILPGRGTRIQLERVNSFVWDVAKSMGIAANCEPSLKGVTQSGQVSLIVFQKSIGNLCHVALDPQSGAVWVLTDALQIYRSAGLSSEFGLVAQAIPGTVAISFDTDRKELVGFLAAEGAIRAVYSLNSMGAVTRYLATKRPIELFPQDTFVQSFMSGGEIELLLQDPPPFTRVNRRTVFIEEDGSLRGRETVYRNLQDLNLLGSSCADGLSAYHRNAGMADAYSVHVVAIQEPAPVASVADSSSLASASQAQNSNLARLPEEVIVEILPQAPGASWRPLILVLASQARVHWQVRNPRNAQIKEVVLSSNFQSKAFLNDKDMAIPVRSLGFATGWSTISNVPAIRFENFIRGVRAAVGMNERTFQSCVQGARFSVPGDNPAMQKESE